MGSLRVYLAVTVVSLCVSLSMQDSHEGGSAGGGGAAGCGCTGGGMGGGQQQRGGGGMQQGGWGGMQQGGGGGPWGNMGPWGNTGPWGCNCPPAPKPAPKPRKKTCPPPPIIPFPCTYRQKGTEGTSAADMCGEDSTCTVGPVDGPEGSNVEMMFCSYSCFKIGAKTALEIARQVKQYEEDEKYAKEACSRGEKAEEEDDDDEEEMHEETKQSIAMSKAFLEAVNMSYLDSCGISLDDLAKAWGGDGEGKGKGAMGAGKKDDKRRRK